MGKKSKKKDKATVDGLERTAALVCNSINMQLEQEINRFESSSDPKMKFINDKILNVGIKWLTMNGYKVKDDALEAMDERAKTIQKLRKQQGSAALRVVNGRD